ncbi:MAG: T9SS type A sorting domain-containing protein, partial [Flavobacteriales bacterium]|nr:T9SS type A sorting domain-containing protein [Flavobacteriales bacterium]
LVSETDNVSDINAAAATFINIENGFGLILTENLQNAEVRVFDVAGKLVARTRVNGTIGRQDFTFENLTTGAYVVRLSAAGNQLATTRFVK